MTNFERELRRWRLRSYVRGGLGALLFTAAYAAFLFLLTFV